MGVETMRKILTGSILAVGLLLAAPVAANPYNPFDPCYLNNGCWWSEGDARWYCNDANIYALCLSPDG
jgi:hypothetical protein